MKTTVDIRGLDALQGTLRGFSERRLRAVAATLLTRSAKDLVGAWNGELFANIDRPTSYTLNSPAMTRATADNPVAEIFIKDKAPRPGAPTPADWLEPQEFGGSRFTKKFELLLMRNGNMPAGHKVVPGPFAKLDGYGNISRSQITQVITQLGVRDAAVAPGYAQTVSAKGAKRQAAAKRAGRKYVAVVRRVGKLRPGVYERSGRELLPVMFFVTQVQYHQRIDLEGNTARDAPAILQREGDRAIAEHIARLEAQGRR